MLSSSALVLPHFFAAFPSPILSCLNAKVRKTTSMHQMATGENAKKLRPSRRIEPKQVMHDDMQKE
jgi:hypothetical protein